MHAELDLESWVTLDETLRDELARNRKLVHWAVQPVGAAGRALAVPAADESHTSLCWDAARRRFVGTTLEVGQRVALRLPENELLVLDSDDEIVGALELSGQTLLESLAWVGRMLGGGVELERPGYDMPEHPAGVGEPFADPDPAIAGRLADWYTNAWSVAEYVRASEEGASAVRCWPHHFDVATLIELPAQVGPAEARSIGAGWSPGDANYDEPYFYVTPWPYPEPVDLPELAEGGAWHTAGWVGAVLPARRIVGLSSGPDQANLVQSFVRSAIAAARELLERGK